MIVVVYGYYFLINEFIPKRVRKNGDDTKS